MKRLILAGVALTAIGGTTWTVSAGGAQARPSPPAPPVTQAPVNVPGQPTVARMFVLNRTEAEAIPVKLLGGETLPVSVMGAPSVRASRQAWEYRQVAVVDGDLTNALNAAGADGWEAVGVVSSSGQTPGPAVLLKRPR